MTSIQYIRTKHFLNMLEERDIREEWVTVAIQSPDEIEDQVDGTRHFLKKIPERGGRWLRVIVNRSVQPNRAVTVFFDRRMRRNP